MATESENELIKEYPRKNCWVSGLHKIFASKEDISTCTVVDRYKEFVSEYTVIYAICDSLDKHIFGEDYGEGTTWIITNKTLFQCGRNYVIETTCSELFNLIEQGNLIAGTKYRVTDYTCQQNGEEYRSLNHKFDIIFTALDEKTLDEWCTAIPNRNEDYFSTSDLTGWVIRCVLKLPKLALFKTDINEYPDEIDEDDYYLYDGQFVYDGYTYDKWKKFDNGVGTDNSEDRGWWILTDPSQDLTSASLENPIKPVGSIKDDVGMGEDMYLKAIDDWIVKYVSSYGDPYITILYMKDENGNECYYDFKNIQFKRYMITSVNNAALEESILNTYIGIKNGYGYDIDEGDYIWVYTFGRESDESITGNCRDNKIGYFGTPNNITMLYGAKDNEFGNCRNISIGENCYSNNFLDYCNNNTFGNYNYNTIFGNYNSNNTFGNSNHNIIFGNDNFFNIFGNSNFNNSFGNNFQYNTVDTDVAYLDFTVNYSDTVRHIHILSGYRYPNRTAVPIGIVTNASFCQFIGFAKNGTFACKSPLD